MWYGDEVVLGLGLGFGGGGGGGRVAVGWSGGLGILNRD